MGRRWLNKYLVFGLIYFTLFIGVVLAVEFKVFGEWDTFEVVRAKDDIEPGTVITKDHIYTDRWDIKYKTDAMIVKESDIIGLRLMDKAEKNSFFTKDMFDEAFLKPTDEHQYFPIPNKWIIDLQGSLRRYDIVDIIAVKESIENSEVPPEAQLHKIEKKPIIEDVPIVYLKNSRNSEVEGEQGLDDRLNSKSTPSNIELSLTLEQFKILEEYYLKGYRFIFAY